MPDDRCARAAYVLLGIGRTQRRRLVDRQPGGHVPDQRIVRRRLIRDEIEVLAATRKLRYHVRGVSEQRDRQRATFLRRAPDARESIVHRIGRLVEVARREATLDARGIDLDAENRRARHRRREGLRTAHAAETRCENRPAVQVGAAEVALAGRGKCLVRALQDSLRPDVDP